MRKLVAIASDYSIFFDEETGNLFAVEKIDHNVAWKDLSREQAIRELEMVFHLDTGN